MSSPSRKVRSLAHPAVCECSSTPYQGCANERTAHSFGRQASNGQQFVPFMIASTAIAHHDRNAALLRRNASFLLSLPICNVYHSMYY